MVSSANGSPSLSQALQVTRSGNKTSSIVNNSNSIRTTTRNINSSSARLIAASTRAIASATTTTADRRASTAAIRAQLAPQVTNRAMRAVISPCFTSTFQALDGLCNLFFTPQCCCRFAEAAKTAGDSSPSDAGAAKNDLNVVSTDCFEISCNATLLLACQALPL